MNNLYRTEFDMLIWQHTLTYNGYIIKVNRDVDPRMFQLLDKSGNVITQGLFLHDLLEDIEAIAPLSEWSLSNG